MQDNNQYATECKRYEMHSMYQELIFDNKQIH